MSKALPFHSAVSIKRMPRGILLSSRVPARELSFAEIVNYGFPHLRMDTELRKWKIRNLPNFLRGMWRILTAKKIGIPALYGQLCLAVISPNGHRRDYGLVSLRMITSSGAGFVSDGFQGSVSISTMRYHGLGGGSTPESASDSGLGSEFSGQYDPVNTRATGTLGEGDSANIFRSIGFVEVNDTVTIAEHGIFSQAATTGGVMLDRTALASETIFAGFVIQCDYRLTVSTGT